VEVLSGDAAEHLDRSAGGIAARLRFPLDALAAGAPAATVARPGSILAPAEVDNTPYKEYP
jgi:hypothetical protein